MNKAQRKTHRWVFTVLGPVLLALVVYALVSRDDPHAGSSVVPQEQAP